jgi:hypothetical protein
MGQNREAKKTGREGSKNVHFKTLHKLLPTFTLVPCFSPNTYIIANYLFNLDLGKLSIIMNYFGNANWRLILKP